MQQYRFRGQHLVLVLHRASAVFTTQPKAENIGCIEEEFSTAWTSTSAGHANQLYTYKHQIWQTITPAWGRDRSEKVSLRLLKTTKLTGLVESSFDMV